MCKRPKPIKGKKMSDRYLVVYLDSRPPCIYNGYDEDEIKEKVADSLSTKKCRVFKMADCPEMMPIEELEEATNEFCEVMNKHA